MQMNRKENEGMAIWVGIYMMAVGREGLQERCERIDVYTAAVGRERRAREQDGA